ncbi:NADH-quinone oxidoreductase subunit M [Prescottella sp. R16]|uniref:NADH-quinone oxidoreductase subunit M n=1 Tax=Prescottella sp. R16 TaxID=3064529 RepID=UPI00272EB6DB|nr:NADH-quinone oxidoreductase subunit M [Prescottella sp. R16]
MTGFPWLTTLWLLPAVGAVLVMLLPAHERQAARIVALVAAAGTFAVSVGLAIGFDPGGEHYQFVESRSWITAFGTRYELGLDGIGLALVLLTTVLVPLLLLAGWRDVASDDPRPRAVHMYAALILVVESLVLMSFLSLDILLFYIVFEAMLIPMYFLLGGFGEPGPQRARAAVKFLLYNLFGGLIMLAAVIGLYAVTAGADSPFSAGTFDLRAIVTAVSSGDLVMSAPVTNALFLGFMFAFAVKAPLWPLHSWLPDAAARTTPVSAVLMMAVVDKVGTFAMLRYTLTLFPDAARTFAPLLVTLAVISVVYGALLAIGQTDVMRLIAYTSISHFGFIVLGLFAMTSQGQSGGVLYMVAHGISTAALMLVAGFLVTRRGSRVIADYGGVQTVAPLLAGTFLVAGMATLSLPGLAPFVSEFLVLVGTFTRYPAAAVIATVAIVLAALYILWLYQRMMGGPVTAGTERVHDLRRRELLVVAPLLALLIGIGVYPKPLLDIVTPAVTTTLTTIGAVDPAPTTTDADGGAR